MARKVFKYGAVCLAAVIIEILVFNFSYLLTFFPTGVTYNIVIQGDELEYVNWFKTGDTYVSQPDPMIITENINENVSDITVNFKASADLSSISVFYSDNENPFFNGDDMIQAVLSTKDHVTVKINRYVKDLRVDLGEEAGLSVNNVMITLNPRTLNISVSRIVAMILICLAIRFLFSIQRIPSYNVDGANCESKQT